MAPPGPLTLASIHGSAIAVAASGHVAALRVDPATGTPTLFATAELSQQASALALFPAPAPAGSCTPNSCLSSSGGGISGSLGATAELLVAAGLWVENAVVLLRWPAAHGGASGESGCGGTPGTGQHPVLLEPVCRLELGGQQPRSLAVLDVAGRTVLVAGTSQGQVRGGGMAGAQGNVKSSRLRALR